MVRAVTRLTAMVLLALVCGAVPVAWESRHAASDSPQPFGRQLPRGTRVAVVAFHDSGLLTMCPIPSAAIIESTYWDSSMTTVKATFVRTPTGDLAVRVYDPALLHTPDAWVGMATLPLPPRWTPAPGVTPPRSRVRVVVRGAVRSTPPVALPVASGTVLDRLALDLAVQARVEAALRKKGTYVVVGSPSEAEYVLVVESGYTVIAVGLGDNPPKPTAADASRERPTSPEQIVADTEREFYARSLAAWHDPFAGWTPPPMPALASPATRSGVTYGFVGGDRPPNWRQWTLALAVPAETYRRHEGDGTALTAARVWEGFAFEQTPRMSRVMVMRAAAPEALADNFSAAWRDSAAGLPLCAASSQVLLMPNAGRQATPEAVPPAPPEPPEAERPSTAQFRTSTILVTVPLIVRDPAGHPVLDVRPSELHVFEDDSEQKIEAFLPVAAAAHVALLVDTSSSMRSITGEPNATPGPAEAWRPDGRLLSALQTFIDRLQPADQLLLASFSNRVRVHTEWTSDHTLVRQALTQLVIRGATRLYDGMTLVVADRLAALEGRKAMVLFTDGVDTRSQLADAATALNAVDRANTQVYVIRYETADAPPYPQAAQRQAVREWLVVPDGWFRNARAYAEADAVLARLAGVTGGRMYVAPADGNLADVFADIDKELTQEYTLSYYSSNGRFDGKYREIRVTIDRPGHGVRARKGYRAPASGAATR
jgi:VWFA-related protein